MSQQTVCITGATDGIGLALARLYHQRGARMILVGRRPLEDMDDPLFTADTYCRADLSQPDCAGILTAFLEHHDIQQVDVLVNNAGTGYYGSVEDEALDDIRNAIAVNLRAPIALTHALLPALRRAGGQIVFISSVVSAMPSPSYAVYGATKAAIDGLARNLRIEFDDDDLAVQVIHPGATRTRMHEKVGMPAEQIERIPLAPPDDVARKILATIDAGTPAAVIGTFNALLRGIGRHLAGVVDAAMRLGRRFS